MLMKDWAHWFQRRLKENNAAKSAVHKLVKQQVWPHLLKLKPVTLPVKWNSKAIYPPGSTCVSSDVCVLLARFVPPGSRSEFLSPMIEPSTWPRGAACRAVSRHGRGRRMVIFTQQQQDPLWLEIGGDQKLLAVRADAEIVRWVARALLT